ncbi:hypothetical protein [Deinococcus sp. AJ005]|uniref:hypothetical protein n=1 Tax=Deinococcus sp. AJ005 TaxID=2652443 RepID=UPI00125CB0C5|nr:hypothetical protein [Deinococcus sp. AJ005]QFP78557.1 hypothetical protein DAAJ005_18475 [Deinococcus sp. AJ005]
MTAQPSSAEVRSISPIWPLWKRLGFRFAVVYGLLYVTAGLFLNWRPVTEWAAWSVLGRVLPVRSPQNESGDTLENYVLMGLYLVVAVMIALLWSVLERRGNLTERLSWPVHTVLRLYLGFVLLGYGWAKILLAQMPALQLTDLTVPLGEMSPMGLLWRSVAFSPLYEVMGGVAEAVAGTLLLFRRTSLPGALLGAGVLAYVFLLNLSFDVPVKLYSLHLLLFSLLTLTPFLPRLSALLLNSRVEPIHFPTRHARPLRHWTAVGLQTVVLLAALVVPPLIMAQSKRGSATIPSSGALAGIYRVLDDSRPAASSLSEDRRWHTVTFNDRFYRQGGAKGEIFLPVPLRVELVNGTRLNGSYQDDPTASTVQIDLAGVAYMFKYQIKGGLQLTAPDGTRLSLGPDTDATRLTTRGFHWVNEVPDNR